jgi:hypothetical protein
MVNAKLSAEEEEEHDRILEIQIKEGEDKIAALKK